jgi:hypothetical protein
MVNLFAFRATKPEKMAAAADPIGPENDINLHIANDMSDMVVAAWGASYCGLLDRDTGVRKLFSSMYVLRLTKHGHPSHPLYLPANLTPTLWFTSLPPKRPPNTQQEPK